MDPAGFEFRPSDGYATVEEKLRKLFPRPFDWLCDSDPSDSTTSPWLICVKSPHQKIWQSTQTINGSQLEKPLSKLVTLLRESLG